MKRYCLLFAAWLVVGIASAQEPISYPMLMSVHPLAAQIGTTAEYTVDSRYTMEGAYQVFVDGSGVRGEVGSAVSAKPPITALRVRFTVAPDALPGVREFRIVTPQGVSTVGQLVVVRDPVTVENDKNNSLATAQNVMLPATICGTIAKAEQADYFKFSVLAGQSLSFLVRSARCEDKIHDLQIHVDPILTLRDARNTVLATNDNQSYADPLLNYRFKEAGEYTIEIRDVRFQGNIYWRYAIEINDRPLVTNVFPLALRPEQATQVELIGLNLPKDRSAVIRLPGNLADGPQCPGVPGLTLQLTGVSVAGQPKVAVPVVVTNLPTMLARDDHHTPSQAQAISLPIGVNGRIATPGGVDYYAFEAKKGERFSFDCVARRHESALDPVLAILNDKGARLTENDDFQRHRITLSDSQIENWTAPADGRFVVEVRDMLGRGGEAYVYFLQATRAEPYFLLDVDTDKCVFSPGGYTTIFVRGYRRNGLTGDIQLAIDGLPAGVTASCGRILDGREDGVIVLHAASELKPTAVEVRISGTIETKAVAENKPAEANAAEGKAAEQTVKLSAIGQPWQETYLPGGGRGLWPVEHFVVSIAAPLDLRTVKIKPTEITLKPGESQKIEVVVERAKGFNKNVTLDVMYRHLGGISGNSLPAGVTIDEKASKTLLAGEQTVGAIVLTAAKDAKPVTRQETSILAHVSLNFVMKLSYSSESLFITVTE
jgi:hypothetical protein